MNDYKAKIEAILDEVEVEAQSWDAMNGYSMRPKRKVDYKAEATASLLQLVQEAKIWGIDVAQECLHNGYVDNPFDETDGMWSNPIAKSIYDELEKVKAELKREK